MFCVSQVNIAKTKVLLKIKVNIHQDMPFLRCGHQCPKCIYRLTPDECEVLDHFPELESEVQDEVKGTLVYIAGYIFRKSELDVIDEECESKMYFESFGSYTAGLDRGGLCIPNDSQCKWTIFSYMMFQMVKHSTCRTSLSCILDHISAKYRLQARLEHARIISNILFNNFCAASKGNADKEVKLKVLKLSQ